MGGEGGESRWIGSEKRGKKRGVLGGKGRRKGLRGRHLCLRGGRRLFVHGILGPFFRSRVWREDNDDEDGDGERGQIGRAHV